MAAPQFERRASDRLITPKCQRCDTSERVACVNRQPRFLYFRCASCDRVWSVLKPERTDRTT
jgi:hypothetical protein